MERERKRGRMERNELITKVVDDMNKQYRSMTSADLQTATIACSMMAAMLKQEYEFKKVENREASARNEIKIHIVSCDTHNHHQVFVNDTSVISNDYSVENIYRLAKYFGWEVTSEEIDHDEYKERYT